jgi:thiol-disulfide isomerase/thioredoxin
MPVLQRFKRLPFFALVLLMSCGREQLPEKTLWNGSVQLPEVKIPIRMELDLTGAIPAGYFVVGSEKTAIPEIVRNGDSLTFNFSEYGAEMRSTWDGKELKGEYLRIRSTGTKTFPFTASPASSPKPNAVGATEPAGDFQVMFEDRKPDDPVTVAKFWKENGSYLGTFIAPDGDYGLLEGTTSPQGMQFSRFTGWQVIAIEMKPDGAGWAGRFHAASNDKPRGFALQSSAAAEPSVANEPSMKNPESPFAFACASLEGEMVRNTDERFKGKALAVDIMGTWCHNCMDESPVLEQLRKEYGKEGFEVVGLSFEISDDAELGKKNLRLFRDRFGLTYPLLYCGGLDDANVDQKIKSQIDNFFAYPTTLFVDKKNKVQIIHSGFRGPGTGDQYPLQIQTLHEFAKQVIRQGNR